MNPEDIFAENVFELLSRMFLGGIKKNALFVFFVNPSFPFTMLACSVCTLKLS